MQTTATGAWAGASFHAPFGDRWHSEGSLATDRRYTGQRSLEGSLGSLYHYQARWYSPVLGRFLSPDPIVPEPGNPQSLNRYSYVYNNPYAYVDPSGYDPLDQAWRDSFYQQHGRQAEWYDEMIRLYSIAGFGDESQFYSYYADGAVVPIDVDTYDMSFFLGFGTGRSWQQMPEILDRMAKHYGVHESRLFVHDLATLFAGFHTRSETDLTIALWRAARRQNRKVWVHLDWRNPGLDAEWVGVDKDANIHHWAAFLALGYVDPTLGPLALLINTGRELAGYHTMDEGNVENGMPDIRLGNAAVSMGVALNFMPLFMLKPSLLFALAGLPVW